MVKTYFITTQKENRFPSDFIVTKNKRYIQIVGCKVVYKQFMPGDIKVHASFILRDHYEDYFTTMANYCNHYQKKFEYNSERQDFHIWFTNMNGDPIEPDSFILELLLIY